MSPRPAPAGGGGVFVGGHGDTATVASVVNLGTGTTPQAVIPPDLCSEYPVRDVSRGDAPPPDWAPEVANWELKISLHSG